MSEEKKEFTEKEKIAYFKKRAADKTLTDGQRAFAAKRLYELTGGKQGKLPVNNGEAGFGPEEKRQHYRAVSKGEKAPKSPSKFDAQRQKDYATGQVDARDEFASAYGRKNFTPEERRAYAEQKYGARPNA